PDAEHHSLRQGRRTADDGPFQERKARRPRLKALFVDGHGAVRPPDRNAQPVASAHHDAFDDRLAAVKKSLAQTLAPLTFGGIPDNAWRWAARASSTRCRSCTCTCRTKTCCSRTGCSTSRAGSPTNSKRSSSRLSRNGVFGENRGVKG